MGAIHNELRRGQLSKAVTRALGMQVGSVGLERLSESLTVVMDLWSRPEFAYLRKEDRFLSGQQSGTNVGTISYCQLRVPVNSNILCIVDRLILQDPTGAGPVEFGLSTPNASGTPGCVMDSRRNRGLGVGTGAVSVALASARTDLTGDGVAFGLVPCRVRFNASQLTLDLDNLGFVLAAGEALTVRHTAANNVVGVNFFWRERTALPGELD